MSISSSQNPTAKAAKIAMAMMPKPKPPVAAAEGTLRNQPREATWLRTDSRIRLVGRHHAAAVGKIPRRPRRLAVEQAGQEHHFVWSCRLARIDQGDLEVVLAVALDGQRAPHREVNDRGRGLSGVDLAVDQQAGLCDRNLRRRERDRDGEIGVVRHDLALLTGKRNHSRR